MTHEGSDSLAVPSGTRCTLRNWCTITSSAVKRDMNMDMHFWQVQLQVEGLVVEASPRMNDSIQRLKQIVMQMPLLRA